MNIAIVGYGKMGKMVESIAVERGHEVVLTIDIDNREEFTRENLEKTHAVIEFTQPETAFDNVVRCLEYGLPVVSGSTGWHDRIDEVNRLCTERNGSMLCTTNCSLGVNIFFEINRRLARIMNQFPEYTVEIEETHHTQKKDAPSGTAITIAEGVIDEISHIEKWELVGAKNISPNEKNISPAILPIRAIRKENIPGTHQVKYTSEIDDIEIIHTAHSRKGFALGAVLAAEYIHNRKGVFSMKDVLNISTAKS